MPPITNILQLRQFLAERVPSTRVFSGHTPAKRVPCWPTGLPQIDGPLGGGLPGGSITEVIRERRGGGGALLLRALLQQAGGARQWMALIDGCDCFEPGSLEDAARDRLLWVRCRGAAQALQAVDLVLRDGNLTLVVLDLQINPTAQLRRIPASTWHRFRRLLEPSATVLLVLTPEVLVSSAPVRMTLRGRLPDEALGQSQEKLLARLEIELVRTPGFHETTVAMVG